MLNLAVRNTSKLIREKSKTENVRLGRLFTKKNTARLMADMIKLDPEKTAYTILDPGAGTGILAAAAVEQFQPYVSAAAKAEKSRFFPFFHTFHPENRIPKNSLKKSEKTA